VATNFKGSTVKLNGLLRHDFVDKWVNRINVITVYRPAEWVNRIHVITVYRPTDDHNVKKACTSYIIGQTVRYFERRTQMLSVYKQMDQANNWT
jgi:hypothetical protein